MKNAGETIIYRLCFSEGYFSEITILTVQTIIVGIIALSFEEGNYIPQLIKIFLLLIGFVFSICWLLFIKHGYYSHNFYRDKAYNLEEKLFPKNTVEQNDLQLLHNYKNCEFVIKIKPQNLSELVIILFIFTYFILLLDQLGFLKKCYNY